MSNFHYFQIRMSVLLPKDDVSTSKNVNSIRDRSPRQKGQSKSSTQQQQNRDSLKLVNEKNAANLQVCLCLYVALRI